MPKKTNFKGAGKNNDYFRITATVGKDADGKPIRKQFYGTSKREAQAKRDDYLAGLKQGLAVGFDKLTFGDAFSYWLENVSRPKISLSSYTKYESDYRLRIKNSVLANMKLIDIHPPTMQAYFNDLLKTHSVFTVWQTHKLLKTFFIYCVKNDSIIKNPLRTVELPEAPPKTEINRALNDDEVKKITASATENANYFIFMFAALTGLRLGEILALTHKDIDFTRNVVKVSKSLRFLKVDGEYTAVITSPKTEDSIRDIPLLDGIKTRLKIHIVNEKTKHLKLGKPFSDDCIMFSSDAGPYREASHVRKILARLCKKVEMERCTFHSLRHAFCTILARQGVPLKTASVLMGHSDISITAKIYTHVDNAELKKGIEKLSVYFES
jgi:integrase